MMITNRRSYRTLQNKNSKSAPNKISFLIPVISFSYITYLLLYFYEIGFLNYHGISSDFVEISIENICNFFIIIFAFFSGVIIISLGNILIKDTTEDKFMLCLGFCVLGIISYYGYKIFSNFDYFISNYSHEKVINHLYTSYSIAFISVILFIALTASVLNIISIFLKKVKHLTWNEFLKKYTSPINIEYTIKILFFFTLTLFICCYFAFQTGRLTAEKSIYNIGYYKKQQLALIKTMKNGIGIFIPINKDKKYKKEHFLLLQLGESAVNFTEKSHIEQMQN